MKTKNIPLKMKLARRLADELAGSIQLGDELPSQEFLFRSMREVIQEAYLHGFDRAKFLYVDYAKRFLGKDHLKLFEMIGEQPNYPQGTENDYS